MRGRPAGLVVTALLAAFGWALVSGASPAAAAYPPWEEGTNGHPFSLPSLPASLTLRGEADRRLELSRSTLDEIGPSAPMWDFWPSGSWPDPRMAYPLANGHVYVSGGKDVSIPYVLEVDGRGVVQWEYRNGTDGLLRKPFSAEPATFGGRACVLISDRIACRVFAVDKATKEVVWQYGTTDTPGRDVNQLGDPFCATQITPGSSQTDGNVLIADSNDNHRVIEVRADDYDPSAPDLGYTADSIVWQYGVTGQLGTAPGYLNQARSPQRLANGDTLITDAASRRILCVRDDYDPTRPDNGYTADSVVWEYVGEVDGPLEDPNTARLITSGALAGDVLVTDAKGQTVKAISFDSAKRTEFSLDLATYERPPWVGSTDASGPRDARIGPDGALWVADAGFGRILEIGNHGTATATSSPLTCGYPRMVKAFDRIKIQREALPAGSGITLWYSVDGGKKFVKGRPSGDGLNIDLPAGTAGRSLTYRVTLASRDLLTTPSLEGLVIHFTQATTGGGGGGGGGSGGTGNSGQSSTYTYPSTAPGGTGVSGTGTGSGSYGTGSGAGNSGTGAGSTGSGAGGAPAASSVDVPVESTGSGPPQQVQGLEVQGEEGVSGVPLRAAPGAQAPEPERPGPPVPALALVAAGLVVAAAFFVPWPFVAAHMRWFTGFDHTNPARSVPFRPLGK
jgi:hypothetical protein